MLAATLPANLLRSALAGKGIIRTVEGTNRCSQNS